MTELRPYQEAAREAIEKEWDEGHKRTLLVLPTGTGKTVVFSKVAEDQVRAGNRVLILAHRGELLDQAADKLYRMTGLKSSIEKADQTALGTWNRVTVGSVQSLQRENRLKKFNPNYYGTIIIDEAHHAITDGYRRIIDHFPDARVLGVTATPDRGDQRKLGEVFESLAYEYSIVQAIKDGYLCKIVAQTVPLQLDMTSLKTQAGDYTPGSIDTALDPYLDQIAEEMKKYCMNRKTVVFLPLIATSKKFQGILNSKGFRAAEVNGQSEDREQVLKDFAADKYNVICNSMLLTEGWDCPDVDCIVCLRPTKVRSLYCQMVGRGTRICKGKDNLLILDFLWMTEKHELCRPADIICTSKEVSEKMTKNLEEEAGQEFDIEEAEEKAESEVLREREEALAAQLEAMKKRKRKLVDPLQFEMSISDEDLALYQPSLGWEMGPPTEKQINALEHYGIFPDEIECAGKAELILDKLAKRRFEGLATPKQIRFLESRGFLHVGTWSFDSANNMISRVANNNWRIPEGVIPETYSPRQ
jgi:superfamily II DNA or RNA helicase